MIANKHPSFRLFILASLILLIACGKQSTNEPYDQALLVEKMNYLDQQAYVIWGNSGSEWDKDGERELFPTTDEGWQELVQAGKELIAIGQDLKGYINKDDPRAEAWSAYAAAISDVSQKLVVAAQEQDKAATFDEGGVLYQVCKACHSTFPAPGEEE
jgi:hypothetical protein